MFIIILTYPKHLYFNTHFSIHNGQPSHYFLLQNSRIWRVLRFLKTHQSAITMYKLFGPAQIYTYII